MESGSPENRKIITKNQFFVKPTKKVRIPSYWEEKESIEKMVYKLTKKGVQFEFKLQLNLGKIEIDWNSKKKYL